MMTKLHFAQPLVRADSPDFKHLRNLPEKYTIDTPGGRLAGALQYYTAEAYARKTDRDAACGMTAHPDIKYVPVAALPVEDANKIGCGYAIGHPLFEKVIDFTFSMSVNRLTDNMRDARQNANGSIAVESILIARSLYFIEAIADRGHIKFQIDGMAAFERGDRSTIDSTCAFLEDRLRLHFLATLPKRRAH